MCCADEIHIALAFAWALLCKVLQASHLSHHTTHTHHLTSKGCNLCPLLDKCMAAQISWIVCGMSLECRGFKFWSGWCFVYMICTPCKCSTVLLSDTLEPNHFRKRKPHSTTTQQRKRKIARECVAQMKSTLPWHLREHCFVRSCKPVIWATTQPTHTTYPAKAATYALCLTNAWLHKSHEWSDWTLEGADLNLEMFLINCQAGLGT